MAKLILVSVNDADDRRQLISQLPLLGRFAYQVNEDNDSDLIISDEDIGSEKAQEVLYSGDDSELLASGRVVEV